MHWWAKCKFPKPWAEIYGKVENPAAVACGLCCAMEPAPQQREEIYGLNHLFFLYCFTSAMNNLILYKLVLMREAVPAASAKESFPIAGGNNL